MTAVVVRGDAARLPLPDGSVDLIVCSPPYFGLRSYADTVKCYDCIQMEYSGRDPRQAWPDYDAHVEQVHRQHYDGQIGSEATPAEYLEALWACTAEWVRVLKPGGSVFVNLGDKYSGNETGGRLEPSGSTLSNPAHMPRQQQRRTPYRSGIGPKSLLGLPWRYAIGCTDRLGLILRAEIVWAKPNGLPESVTDRVRRSHEQVFHMTRQPSYYSAVDEIRAPAVRTDTRKIAAAYLAGVAPGSRGHTGLSDRANHPLGTLPGSVWSIPSAPLVVPERLGVDHFAAYPPELVRRIVLGWSPPGVCTACGEGRRPVVDRQYVKRDNGRPVRVATYTDNNFGGASPLMRDGTGYTTATITGYACGCPVPDAPARPALVVDPFGGTGTTALVASVLGRTGITVDRSGDYCRLAAWRVRDPGERARALGVPKPPPVPDGQGSLFGDDLEDAG